MKKCTNCGVEKPLTEFHKDAKSADGYRARCKPCKKATERPYDPDARKQAYETNKAAEKLAAKKRYAAKREEILAGMRARYETDREYLKAVDRVWRKANPDKVARAQKKYRDANPHKVAATAAKRRATRARAAPPWLTRHHRAQIEAIYAEAALRQTPHQVDHIVPLNSTVVCGLHVPWNLEVLPAKANLSKSNRCWPDAWDEEIQLQYMML